MTIKSSGGFVPLFTNERYCNEALSSAGNVGLMYCIRNDGDGAEETLLSPPAIPDGAIVIEVASADNVDPAAAGKASATALKERMGKTAPHVIIMAECFEEEDLKKAALEGVASVFPKERIFGCATYGSFDKTGCLDLDSVTLLGIGGDGIGVSAALMPKLDIAGLTMEDNLDLLTERLHTGGRDIGERRSQERRGSIADCHG